MRQYQPSLPVEDLYLYLCLFTLIHRAKTEYHTLLLFSIWREKGSVITGSFIKGFYVCSYLSVCECVSAFVFSVSMCTTDHGYQLQT